MHVNAAGGARDSRGKYVGVKIPPLLRSREATSKKLLKHIRALPEYAAMLIVNLRQVSGSADSIRSGLDEAQSSTSHPGTYASR